MNNTLLKAQIVFFTLLIVAGSMIHSEEMVKASLLFFGFTGIVYGINYVRLKISLPQGDGVGDRISEEGLKVRLDEIDQRLTDVQDVMIALSEKFDRWEKELREESAC